MSPKMSPVFEIYPDFEMNDFQEAVKEISLKIFL